MITPAIKDTIVRHLNSNGHAQLYNYSIWISNQNPETLVVGDPTFKESRSCKQELCRSINVNENISKHWISLNKILDKKKFKANLNKIEELLEVKVGKLCFLTLEKGTVVLLMSHKSFWARNLLLLDLFCILVRSANTGLDIKKLDDIFYANHTLASKPEFKQIIDNFKRFETASLQSTELFYQRSFSMPYGVLDFSKELI